MPQQSVSSASSVSMHAPLLVLSLSWSSVILLAAIYVSSCYGLQHALPLKQQQTRYSTANRKHQTRLWSSKIGGSNFTYGDLATMLSKKDKLVLNIAQHNRDIQEQASIPSDVHFKIKVLSIYQRELKATENSFISVLKDLNQTLSSDYHSINDIKHSCKMRQEDMKNAAILVEEDYNVILDLEKEMKSHHPNISLQSHFHLVNEFLSEISHAADTLEHELIEDVFKKYKEREGVAIETVVKLSERSLPEQYSNGNEGGHQMEGISMLIDSSSNQYTLSRPRDVTLPVEDHHFMHDIIFVLLVSFIFGGLCSVLNVPPMFGYVFAGIMVGPTGFNIVGSVVQVETLGEVGVIFIVFMVGMEFSPQKLHKVTWKRDINNI